MRGLYLAGILKFMKAFISKAVITFFFMLTALASIPSCTQNTEVKDDDAKASEALVGVWRGEGGYDGANDAGWKETWKMTRSADGKYAVDYLTINDDEKLYELASDVGTWSYENGIYLETNKNGQQITYTVYSVKDDWFEYNLADRDSEQHIKEAKTEEAYQLRKPPEGYSVVSNEQALGDLIEGVIDQAGDNINQAVKQAVDELAN